MPCDFQVNSGSMVSENRRSPASTETPAVETHAKTCLSKDEHCMTRREFSLISLNGIEVCRKGLVYLNEISILESV